MADAPSVASVPAAAGSGTAGTPPITNAPATGASGGPTAPVIPPGDAAGPPLAPVEAPKTPQESALLKHVRERERKLIERQNEQAARERHFTSSQQATIDAAVAKAIAERDAKIKGDPVAQLQALGFTEQEIAQRLINKGKPAVDEVAQRALEETRKLRDELAQRQVSEARAASERAFLEEIGSDSYENIAIEWPNRSDAMNEARAELQRYAAKGGDPNTITYKQLGGYLEKLARYRGEQRETLKAARKAKATPQGDTKANGNGGPGSGDGTKGQPATTTLGKGLPGSETVSAIGKKGRPPTDAEIIAHVEQQAKLGLLNGKGAHS